MENCRESKLHVDLHKMSSIVLDELWNYFASSISFGNVADYSRIKKKKKSIFLESCAHFCRGGEIARSERVKLDSDGRPTSL